MVHHKHANEVLIHSNGRFVVCSWLNLLACVNDFACVFRLWRLPKGSSELSWCPGLNTILIFQQQNCLNW